jgi:uncharacterized protein (DUF427 family)
LKVVFNGVLIADTSFGYRILETSHPPVYYFPPTDVRAEHLVPVGRTSFCEWKGQARYFHVVVGDREASFAAWTYAGPTPPFAAIKDYLAFYAAPMDACFVGEERARPQPGGFYGGWITDNVVGPFKGEPGTFGW